MKRIWPFAVCIGLVVACHQQKNVRREVWPPPSEPQPKVAASEAPAPPPKVLDPVIVEVDEKSTVGQVRRQLDKGNASRAREVADAALPTAGARDKGRLHWLAATAALDEGYNEVALAHLDTLSHFNHPLSRWAKLRRASLAAAQRPGDRGRNRSLADRRVGRSRSGPDDRNARWRKRPKDPPHDSRRRHPAHRERQRAARACSHAAEPRQGRCALRCEALSRSRATLRQARQTPEDRKHGVVQGALQAGSRPAASARANARRSP